MEQATENKPLEFCGMLARFGSRTLSLATNIALLFVLLYGVFALWDTYAIFRGTVVDSSLLLYKPTIADDGSVSLSLSELMELYPDVCAWLTLDDTNIDYPVVQGENNSTYVNYDIYGEFSLSGAIFLDYRNSGDFSDDYSILYGHHMSMEAMFGGLDLFFEQDYLDTHTTGTLFLTDTYEDLEIFALVSLDAYDTMVFTPFVDDDARLEALLIYIEENAVTYRDITFEEGDKLLAMSTCSTDGTNLRTIVFAKQTVN